MTRYTTNSSGKLIGIKRPSSSTDNITIGYDANNRVSSISNGSASWTYGWSLSGTTLTATVTDPLSHQRVTTANTSQLTLLTDRDALNHTTSYQYDASGRMTRVTAPEGNYVQYGYDARGNVTSTTSVSKTPGTPANIVTTASYDTTCVNIKKCNKPNSTTDARGKVTEYTYDPTHGGLLTVTAPADTSGTRPQTRYSYTSLYAYYKNSSGTIVAGPSPIYKLTGVSSCTTGSSCAGTVNEVKTTIAYGAPGVANNLLPTSSSSGAGNGTLTATTATTYDMVGNRLTVDGPLAGTADTTKFFYDAARQLTMAVGPDPDGAGVRKNGAVQMTYNLDGQPTLASQGTANADGSGFVSSVQSTSGYDALGRKITDAVKNGSTTYAVTQYSYDAANRLDCTAQRMNPAVFGSLPAACTLGTTGSFGQDRITKNGYDAADRLTSVITGYGSSVQRTDQTMTYSNNDKLITIADGKNNRTTYEYDGFDRVSKTRYPSPTTAGTSSSTDYEQMTYDANGNVTVLRLRDGNTISSSYDDLNRQISLGGSTIADRTFSYDLLGRMTAATFTGGGASFGATYDALGRNLTQSGTLGTVSFQYDVAGRRTRTTWADGFYVTYDHDVTGNMTAVRENGATSGVGVLATYSYDDLGRRTGITRGNGTTTNYGFDAVSRLSSMTQNLAGTAQDLTLGFAYNPASQITSNTRSNDVYAWTGHYNVNRNYTANGLNQYTASGSLSLAYDGRGNLTTSGSNSYAYDGLNMMTSASGSLSASLSYDPLDRLYQTTGSSTTRLAYDGQDLIAEYNTSGTLLRRYVHGPGTDEPVVWYEGSGTSDRRFLHADERGSVVALSNSTGGVININSYDEYGIPASTNLGRFQYTGQTWLPETGMYHYKARMYSPTLGRFMQTDPIGYADGMNLYAYVHNDPINGVDPTGLHDCDETKPGCEDDDGHVTPPVPDIVVIGNPNGPPSGPGMPNEIGTPGEGWGGGEDFSPEPEPQIEDEGEEIVVTATKTDLKRCLLAVGGAGLEGFIDPVSIVAGAGKSIYEARERIGDGDYGRRPDGKRFPRTWGHAARLGMRRLIPGYLQASLIVGGVKATFELFSNPSCGLSK